MKNKTVLITGGAGFIGSNLSDFLLEKDYNIICFDNFDSFYDESVKLNNISQSRKSEKYILISVSSSNKCNFL